MTSEPYILWDFDGTLAVRDGMWAGCVQGALRTVNVGHHLAIEDLERALWNQLPWHRHTEIHPGLSADGWWTVVEGRIANALVRLDLSGEHARAVARVTRDTYVDGSRVWSVFDDVFDTLRDLSVMGWRHGILSNHVPELASIVGALRLEDRFDFVLTSGVTGYEKPHPEAFALARRVCGKPKTIWMVGDSPKADIAGATAAGIPAILVRTATTPDSRMSCPDLRGVRDLIVRHDPASAQCLQI